MYVELVGDSRQLAHWREQWDHLASHAAEPNPFFESWMLLPTLTYMRQSGVSVLLAWSGDSRARGELLGLMPVVRRSGYRHLPVSLFTIWRYIHCYLGTPLLKRGHEGAFFEGVIDFWSKRGEYLFDFGNISGDGPVSSELLRVANARALRWDRTESYDRAVFQSNDDPDTYIKAVFPGRHHKDLKRKIRALEEWGEIGAHTVERAALQGCSERFLKLERSGWKGRIGTALDQNPDERAFFEEIIRAGAERGRVFMRVLTAGDKEVAMVVAIRAGGAGFMFKVAFDETRGKSSPGLLLELENIRYFSKESGLAWIDSCTAPGNSMYNRLWHGRRNISSFVVSTQSSIGDTLVGIASALRRLLRDSGSAGNSSSEGTPAPPLKPI